MRSRNVTSAKAPRLGKSSPREIFRWRSSGWSATAKYADIRQGNVPTVYRNILQNPEEQATFPQMAIRTDRDPDSIAAAVRNEVRRRVGNVLVRETTLAAHIDASIVRDR